MSLTAISPIDGRYAAKSSLLKEYVSEYALFKYRVYVEIEYFLFLSTLPALSIKISKKKKDALQDLYKKFTLKDAQKIKRIEAKTNHDVKAVEYFIKDHLTKLNLSAYKEFIHFGLTSQDINNTAFPLMIKEALTHCISPHLNHLLKTLKGLKKKAQNIPLLARTHGQPASPTSLAKEIQVFIERLTIQKSLLDTYTFSGKFGGATGNLNAHKVAYPNINWPKAMDRFLKKLQLKRQQTTTQIEHYDGLCELFHIQSRINTILKDFAQDIWLYISQDYFKQKIKKNEVGSSAMPHKVNPIDFENAEGNIGLANALFHHLSEKLPVSRLQRDLTDSTVLRNVGVPFAHSIIAYLSLIKGIEKLQINRKKIKSDLLNNHLVVAEAIQTILRREGIKNPYEKLKELTRKNTHIDQGTIDAFIESLNIPPHLKKELKKITPENYIGYA